MTQPDLPLIFARDLMGRTCAARLQNPAILPSGVTGFEWMTTADAGKTFASTPVTRGTGANAIQTLWHAYISPRSASPVAVMPTLLRSGLSVIGRMTATGSGEHPGDWPDPAPQNASLPAGRFVGGVNHRDDAEKVALVCGGVAFVDKTTLGISRSYDNAASFPDVSNLSLLSHECFQGSAPAPGQSLAVNALDVPHVPSAMVPPAVSGSSFYGGGSTSFRGFPSAISAALQPFQPAAAAAGDVPDTLYVAGFYEMVFAATGNHFAMPMILRSGDGGRSWASFNIGEADYQDTSAYVSPVRVGNAADFGYSPGLGDGLYAYPAHGSICFPVVDSAGHPLVMPAISGPLTTLSGNYNVNRFGGDFAASLLFAHGTVYLALCTGSGGTLNASGIVTLALPRNSDGLPVGTPSWLLVKSGDLGRTWTLCTAPPGPCKYGALGLAPDNHRLLWNLDWHSDDDGLTWAAN